MTRKHWMVGIAAGAGAGLVIATAVTITEWRLNPSGIYHGQAGTNWDFVLSTWSSWFIPLTLVASGVALAILWWMSRRS